MEQKEIMSKFDELYQKMATSGEQKYMNVFGDTMKRMMSDMVELKPELAKEYFDRLCSINWDNYLTKKRGYQYRVSDESKGSLEYARLG